MSTKKLASMESVHSRVSTAKDPIIESVKIPHEILVKDPSELGKDEVSAK